ncbi:Rho GTPase-activating protein 6 [Eumeta japonica]|uniref:Rho GTPase-activating protein 6 n=1 Tax=Eumeta variegata TaxID=151549 RepID=A0A4C1WAH6_EUMVA|nr:Rho GTPase-activating protein 6 [Eumeta japonica]
MIERYNCKLIAAVSESCDSGEWGGSWAGVEDSGPKVPALVSACLAHLRRHGLNTLGLFRVSASKKRVRQFFLLFQLREEWERGQEAALDGAACPHDVATLLKEFLRDLPDPLLCRDLYAAFLQTQKIRSRRLQWEAMRLVVQLLPVAHRDTLSALLAFLAQLAMHAPDALQPGNKMDAANLATVFAPNILHRNKPNEPASAEQLSERADVINVVRLLIERQAELWTLPAEMLHEAYIHLAHTAPAHLDSLLQRRAECANERLGTSVGSVTAAVASEEAEHERRVWSREEFLHGGAATGGPDRDVPVRRSEKIYGRSRRTRDTASDTSSGSLSSAMTIVTRVRSSTEECGSSGVMCSAPSATPSARTDSAPDSADSASDYNETLGGSDDDSCIITASLHIPAAFPREAPRPRRQAQPPPRRRSTSGSESSAKRDSAVGSSSPASASNTSSPPASPPPAHAHAAVGGGPLRVTVTSTGELKRPSDIDRLISLGRERNTSDARAVVVRQQDESTSPRRPERSRRDAHPAAPAASPAASSVVTVTASATTTTSSSTLYKRGELISSARTPAPPP